MIAGKIRRENHDRQRSTGYNSTYKKLAVQWLNEALCFVSSFVVADSFRLRNRQFLVAANRCEKLKHLNFGQAIDFIPAARKGL